MSVSPVGAAYDARAEEYTALIGQLDQQAADDVALVGRWCDATAGPLLDAGCGPGHWTRFLAGRGRDVLGLDLSARFLAIARAEAPGTALVRASHAAVPLRDASVGGVLAWFSTIHTPPDALPGSLAELARVLVAGGSLLLGFVEGPPGVPFDHRVVTAWSWTVDALAGLLAPAGLEVVEHHHRQDEGQRPYASLVAVRSR